jgi:hypothetical protein
MGDANLICSDRNLKPEENPMKTNEYTSETSKDPLPATQYSPVDQKSPTIREPGGNVTQYIETQTGKMPWVSFLGLSVVSMVASATIVATRKKDKDYGSFVGLWAPCFMLLGVYNKLVQIDKKLTDHSLAMPKVNAEVPSSTSYLS